MSHWSMEVRPEDKRALILEGREIALARVWAAAVWPGEQPGYLLCAGQAQGGHVYLLHEEAADDWQALTRGLAQAVKALGVSIVQHEGGAVGDAYRDRANRLVREEALTDLEDWGERRTLVFCAAPYQALPHYAVGLLKGLAQGQRMTIMAQLELALGQLRQVQALAPAQLMDRLPELPAVRALLFLAAAFDSWPLGNTEAKTMEAMIVQPCDPVAGI